MAEKSESIPPGASAVGGDHARRNAMVGHRSARRHAASDGVGSGANVSALFYNHEDRVERYNMADTLKAQHTAFLTKGHVCYSDMGRVLCSITADTAGWNDAVCGASDDALIHRQVRHQALPGAPQRHVPQRARRISEGTRQVGTGQTRRDGQHQLLQQGHGGGGWAACVSRRSRAPRAISSICASR